jgi:hypothetical protein
VAVSVISKGSGSRSQVTSPLDRSVPHSRRVWKPLRLKLFCADPSVREITLYERTVQNQEPNRPPRIMTGRRSVEADPGMCPRRSRTLDTTCASHKAATNSSCDAQLLVKLLLRDAEQQIRHRVRFRRSVMDIESAAQGK